MKQNRKRTKLMLHKNNNKRKVTMPLLLSWLYNPDLFYSILLAKEKYLAVHKSVDLCQILSTKRVVWNFFRQAKRRLVCTRMRTICNEYPLLESLVHVNGKIWGLGHVPYTLGQALGMHRNIIEKIFPFHLSCTWDTPSEDKEESLGLASTC